MSPSRSHTSRWLSVPLLLLLLLLLASPAATPDPSPRLSGYYDFGAVTEQGEEVWVTLSFDLVNDSDAPAYDVELTVQHPYLDEDFATLWAGTIQGNDHALLGADFVLPDWMFEGFQSGIARLLWVDFTDELGNPHHRIVDLVLMPLAEEE